MMESVGIMVLSLSLAIDRLQFFLEGEGVRTFLLGHGKGRGFVFEVDDVVVVPTISPFHHDVVMYEVGVLVDDDVNGTAAKEDARSDGCRRAILLFFQPVVVGIKGEQGW